MKYYRVIYNSSQKNRAGGVGFGVRTATEGTPEAYIDFIKEQDIFSYNSGNCTSPNPKALLEDGKLILNMPAGYIYTKLEVPSMGTIYVLARKIPVGFDYTYYMKYTAGRLGNYVVDCYLFEEKPTAEIFEMLYDQPAAGSNYFIPRTPVPSPENEEMKTLSLEQQPPLPPCEKPFKSSAAQAISRQAVEVLFAYIEAKQTGKPLIVNHPWKEAGAIMADLYKLLPEEIATETTCYTNYQEEGVKEGYDIFFINEYYSYEIYEGQVCYLNLAKGENLSTKESEAFKENILLKLQQNDLKSVHNQVKWVFSSGYNMIKDKSSQTNNAFYIYCIEPEHFTLKMMERNDEFTTLLSSYIAQNPAHQQPLFERLNALFDDSKDNESLARTLKFIEYLESKRINPASIIEKQKAAVTDFLLQSPANLKAMIQHTGLSQLKRYFDKSRFEQKEDYLDNAALNAYWHELYTWFYTAERQSKKTEIISRIFRNNIPDDIKKRVIADLLTVNERVILFRNTLQKDPQNFSVYWPFLEENLTELNNPAGLNLIQDFSAEKANSKFAPLFYYHITRMSFREDTLKKLDALSALLRENAALKELIIRSLNKNNIYDTIYASLKETAKRGQSNEMLSQRITDGVIPVLQGSVSDVQLQKWQDMQIVLSSSTDKVNEKNFRRIYELTKELQAKEFFRLLVPTILQLTTQPEIKSRVHDIFTLLGWKRSELLNIVRSHKINYKTDYYGCILQETNATLQEAEVLVDRENMDEASAEKFYTTYFAKEYKARHRKSLFARFLSLFKREKKEKEDKKEKKREDKVIDPLAKRGSKNRNNR